ncbi:neutral and basic amino acid transport protein rBAT [Ixodes scapularis]
MNAEEEDHNYHHGCPPRRDIFKITGHAPSLLSPTDVSRRPPGHRPASNNHHHHHNNNNHGDLPISDFFQMERVDKTPCLTPGNVFPTEPTPSYPSLAQVVFDSSKSPMDSCDSCVLEPGSTTTLLETPPKTAGLAEECCESLFVRWNWPALRVGCLLVCVSCLVAVLCVIVGVLLLRQPSCDPDRSWWQGGLMYEVFTASYVDSDDDGFGDFRGLASKLGYIKKLRASALRLTSVFSALDYPLEYEHIIDFDNVDPHLGHMGDFEYLVREVHRNGLRVVLDINPALTSDQHTWAAHWLLDQRGEYAYYYVLVNDTSMNSMPDEDWDDDRRDPHRLFGNQLYLNWSHLSVREDVFRSVKLWLDKGIDGFYVKHLDRLQVQDDRELYEVLLSWRRLLDDLDAVDGRGRILMTSVDIVGHLAGSVFLQPVLELFDLLDVPVAVEGGPANVSEVFGSRVREVLRLRNSSTGPWFSWNIGDSESSRLASRVDVDPLTALFTLWALPGSISVLYGDEIGLRDAFDVTSGRPYRTGQLGLMQWNDSPQANFTRSTPWIPVHPDHTSRNVDNATEVIDALARLTDVKSDIVTLFMDGVPNFRRKKSNCRVLSQASDVLVLERFYPRRARYGAVINFAPVGVTRDLSDFWFEGNVVAGTGASLPTRVNFRELYLEPSEALLVEITS